LNILYSLFPVSRYLQSVLQRQPTASVVRQILDCLPSLVIFTGWSSSSTTSRDFSTNDEADEAESWYPSPNERLDIRNVLAAYISSRSLLVTTNFAVSSEVNRLLRNSVFLRHSSRIEDTELLQFESIELLFEEQKSAASRPDDVVNDTSFFQQSRQSRATATSGEDEDLDIPEGRSSAVSGSTGDNNCHNDMVDKRKNHRLRTAFGSNRCGAKKSVRSAPDVSTVVDTCECKCYATELFCGSAEKCAPLESAASVQTADASHVVDVDIIDPALHSNNSSVISMLIEFNRDLSVSGTKSPVCIPLRAAEQSQFRDETTDDAKNVSKSDACSTESAGNFKARFVDVIADSAEALVSNRQLTADEERALFFEPSECCANSDAYDPTSSIDVKNVSVVNRPNLSADTSGCHVTSSDTQHSPCDVDASNSNVSHANKWTPTVNNLDIVGRGSLGSADLRAPVLRNGSVARPAGCHYVNCPVSMNNRQLDSKLAGVREALFSEVLIPSTRCRYGQQLASKQHGYGPLARTDAVSSAQSICDRTMCRDWVSRNSAYSLTSCRRWQQLDANKTAQPINVQIAKQTTQQKNSVKPNKMSISSGDLFRGIANSAQRSLAQFDAVGIPRSLLTTKDAPPAGASCSSELLSKQSAAVSTEADLLDTSESRSPGQSRDISASISLLPVNEPLSSTHHLLTSPGRLAIPYGTNAGRYGCPSVIECGGLCDAPAVKVVPRSDNARFRFPASVSTSIARGFSRVHPWTMKSVADCSRHVLRGGVFGPIRSKHYRSADKIKTCRV
jgi:hypothetical protein